VCHILKFDYIFIICISLSVAKQYFSAADNARDAVLLHVSSENERQEQRNETGGMTKTTERNILTYSDNCSGFFLCFIQ
jgi:hypothetical protein